MKQTNWSSPALARCLRVVDVEAGAVLHGGGGRVHLGAVRLEAEHEGHLGGADAAGRGARGLAEQAAAEPVRGAGVGARAGAALPSVVLQSYMIDLCVSQGCSWKNGKEVPRWGVAEIQKMSPSTTVRCK